MPRANRGMTKSTVSVNHPKALGLNVIRLLDTLRLTNGNKFPRGAVSSYGYRRNWHMTPSVIILFDMVYVYVVAGMPEV